MKRPLFLLCFASSLLTPVLTFSPTDSVFAKPTSQPKSTLVTPTSLKNTTWRLTSADAIAVQEDSDITLSFTAQGISGSSGCNRYTSSLQSQGNQLKFGAIASTRRACPSPLMEQETAYLRALQAAQSYRLNAEGELEIFYPENSQTQTLRFSPVQTTASSLQTPSSTIPRLEGTAWQLIRLGTSDPLKERPASLAFQDNKLSGTGGCNRFMGQFTLNGDRLTIQPNMATTMMACPAPLMKQEQQILEALKTANRYAINAQGQLLIYAGTDETNPALTFSPDETARRVGIKKTLYVNGKTFPCTGVSRQQCLQGRENANDPWRLIYTPIEGFTYEPGYTYELRIREETIANPPADGSSKKWTLIKVIRKTPWGQR